MAIGFQNEMYNVDEDVGSQTVCVVLTGPAERSIVFTVETQQVTAQGTTETKTDGFDKNNYASLILAIIIFSSF